MKVISYDAAVAAAPYRTPGYLDELLASGIELEDSREGTRWRKI